jgi:phosphohistidine phosphatase
MLYIMRHGLAEDHAPGHGDGARKLTPRGRDKIRKAAVGLRALELSFDVIATSPLARAAETAEIVGRETAGSPAPQAMPELAAGSAPAEILAALKRSLPHEHVLMVGHEPTLSRFASLLIAGSPQAVGIVLKQGGVIALEFDGPVEPGAAKLRWMMTQRQLRKLGK